jgi:hypothetical protein
MNGKETTNLDNDYSSENTKMNIIIIDEKNSDQDKTSRDRNIETTGLPDLQDISLNTSFRKISDEIASRTHSSKMREDSIFLDAKDNMDMFNDPEIHK